MNGLEFLADSLILNLVSSFFLMWEICEYYYHLEGYRELSSSPLELGSFMFLEGKVCSGDCFGR